MVNFNTHLSSVMKGMISTMRSHIETHNRTIGRKTYDLLVIVIRVQPETKDVPMKVSTTKDKQKNLEE